MDEMYSAYMTEVDKDLKENLTESREFIHWKKQVNKTPSGKYTTKKLRKIVVIRKFLMSTE